MLKAIYTKKYISKVVVKIKYPFSGNFVFKFQLEVKALVNNLSTYQEFLTFNLS